MNKTEEQSEIVRHDLKTGEVARIIAFAGTGKTTTLAEYSRVREDLRTAYLAFNKSVEVEARRKFPNHVQTRTIHSLAYASHGRQYQDRLGNLSLITLTRNFGLNVKGAAMVNATLDNWFNSSDPVLSMEHPPACDAEGQEWYSEAARQQALSYAVDAWRRILRKDEWWSMPHSGYLKLYQLSKPKLPFDLIMVDEFQDTNPVTVDILETNLNRGVRLLVVGDPYQAIYGWRGAVNALDAWEADTFYLTQSFRFGQEVADVANVLLKVFYQEKHALRGSDLPTKVVEKPVSGERLTVVARANGTLFSGAIAAVNTGRKVNFNVADPGLLLDDIMDIYYLHVFNRESIKSKRIKLFRSFDDLCQYAKVADLELAQKCRVVSLYTVDTPRIVEKVRAAMVPADAAHTIFTTSHRAKGLEWPNVSVANDFSPLFCGKDVDDDPTAMRVRTISHQRSEVTVSADDLNCQYVAVTRAQKSLHLYDPQLRRLIQGYRDNTLQTTAGKPFNLDGKAQTIPA